MTTVGAYEAKTHFSGLLERAAGGEEITITRRGEEVAKLVPAKPRRSRDEVRAAMERMDERRKRIDLDGITIKELINEGRKC